MSHNASAWKMVVVPRVVEYPVCGSLAAAERLRRRSVVSESGCWEWQGSTTRGYGNLTFEGQSRYAHVLSYETFTGPVPAGMEIDHLCFNTRCVNPAHLEPVTPAENKRRATARRTHCVNGHAFTPDNLARISTRPNTRVCLSCQKARARKTTEKRRAARRLPEMRLSDE